MTNEYPIFNKVRTFILSLVVFLFPLFLLPFTQDLFAYNKMYLLATAALALLVVTSIEVFVTKKIVWQQNKMDKAIVLFAVAVTLSLLVSSPNKVQAALSTNFGAIMIIALSIISLYLVRVTAKVRNSLTNLFLGSALISALVSVVFFFQPFKNASLPVEFSFLQSQYFNTIGNIFDLLILLGFAIVVIFGKIISAHKNEAETTDTTNSTLLYGTLGIVTIGFVLALYVLMKPIISNQAVLPYPPYRLSWNAAVDTLKTPRNAVFGVGLDNFAALFTFEKDVAYNQSNQWEISSFNVSRSALLHVFTEAGMLGLVSLVFMMVLAVRMATNLRSKNHSVGTMLPLVFTIAVMVLFPPSIIVFFLFFLAIALSSNTHSHVNHNEITMIDTSSISAVNVVLSVLGILIVAISGFFLGRFYLAEVYFKNAIVADAKGDIQKVYDNHVQAILLNKDIETYRSSFARVNLFIANNIATNAQKRAEGENKNQDATSEAKQQSSLNDQEKTAVTERVQIAISESKAAVTLNPQKAFNWEQLAVIYRNLLTVAEGADSWTLSAYQRAIALDPSNPTYRISLGGVYYAAKNYPEAQNLFAQAVNLKPDWANAYYNLAWASYQKNDVQVAVNAMTNALSLLNPNTQKADYQKAEKELAEFKKKLPADAAASDSAQLQQPNEQLTLPTPATASVEPRIQLPEDSSPPSVTPVAPSATPTTAPGGP